jgi:hypothetical protein
VVKIMINLNVCSTHSYLYPRSQFNQFFFNFSFLAGFSIWSIFLHGFSVGFFCRFFYLIYILQQLQFPL